MGGRGGVERHGALASRRLAQQDLPVGMQVVDRLGFHPGGEALVEPEVVPPAHGDQIAEPLVGHLVGDGHGHVLAVLLGGVFRVDQQVALEVEDRPPVLHGAKAARAGGGHQVQLGQRIGDAEIVVVVAQQGAGLAEGEARLDALAAPHDHADVDTPDLAADPLQVPHRQEHQIGRHLRRGLEDHPLEAAGQRLHLGDRRVGDGHLAGRRHHAELEARLDPGIVPERREAAGVGVLELGDQHPPGPGGRVVVEVEEAGGEVVDLARVVDRQGVRPGRDGVAEVEAGGLGDGIEGDPGRRRPVEAGVADGKIQRVQHDGRDGLAGLQLDRLRSGEGEMLGIRGEVDPVADRQHRVRQAQGRAGLGRRRFRRRRRRRLGRGLGTGGDGQQEAAEDQGERLHATANTPPPGPGQPLP